MKAALYSKGVLLGSYHFMTSLSFQVVTIISSTFLEEANSSVLFRGQRWHSGNPLTVDSFQDGFNFSPKITLTSPLFSVQCRTQGFDLCAQGCLFWDSVRTSGVWESDGKAWSQQDLGSNGGCQLPGVSHWLLNTSNGDKASAMAGLIHSAIRGQAPGRRQV